MEDPDDPKLQALEKARGRPEADEPNHLPGVDDAPGAPAASPLGRGADPGEVPSTYPLSDRDASVSGQRGMNIPHARAGPSGFEDRENEDVKPSARRAETEGIQSQDNEAERLPH